LLPQERFENGVYKFGGRFVFFWLFCIPRLEEILVTLNENDECRFTDLFNELKIDIGKLSLHLRTLSVFVEQTASGKYKLSSVGENALRVIRDVQFCPEASEVNRKSRQLPIASFKRRTYAFLIDALLVFAITIPI
jgi:hypothetical protein